MKKVQVIAHRGAAAVRPENTMIAFKKAMELGADAIETDVQLTKDGHLVLIHDESLDRTTNGKGWVKEYTLQELKKLDAGSWFSSRYSTEKIPTVDELFTLIHSSPMWVNIEIKDGFFLYPGIEERLIQKIKEYQMMTRVIVSSFNHFSLMKFHTLAPEIKTAILYMGGIKEPWNYAKKIGAKGLHPYYPILNKEAIRHAHQEGFTVYPFTVDRLEEMERLIELGVDGMITNVPDQLISILKNS